MKSLLLALALTASPPAAVGNAPINPLAGLAPNAVVSVSLLRVYRGPIPDLSYLPGSVDGTPRTVTTLNCALTGAAARNVATALASAAPFAGHRDIPRSFSITVQLSDGRLILALWDERPGDADVSRTVVMIDGRLYELRPADVQAWGTIITSCANRAPMSDYYVQP